MKNEKNNSTALLARFGRDKRARTVTASAERVERRPRTPYEQEERNAPEAGARKGYHRTEPPRTRCSYNPNFSADNRPLFENDRRSDEGYRRQERFNRPQRPYDGPARRSFDEHRPYGSREEQGYRNNREEQSYRNSREEQGFRGYRSERDEAQRSEPRAYNGPRPGRYGNSFGRSDERFDAPQRGQKPYGKPGYGPKQGSRSGKPYPRHEQEGPTASRDDRRGSGGKFAAKRRDERPATYPKYDPAKQTGAIRLNRFIAQSGICSRREADTYITAGLVSVNGQIVTELGTKVLPTDEVRFNDSRVQGEKKVYLVLNKPKGYVTSSDDPHAGKTVMELVRGACTERIYPVGRLDKNSLGLLLFTNDGDLTKQLTHPSYGKKKVYQVTLDKPLTRADMDHLTEGITLDDGEIYADEIAYIKEDKQEIGIEIHSGRNRIVRRMFEFLGYTVTKLDRVYYAGLTKKNLNRGRWRFLTDTEVERLKSGLYE